MKACIRCGEVKALSEFYAHPMMSDGHLNKCKGCCKRYSRTRHYQKMLDPEWVEAERVRGRRKSQRYAGYVRDRYHQFPEIPAAEQVAYRAIPKAPTGMERHHWSYRREDWKDVLFVSLGVHRALHNWMSYDPETRYFRTPRGHLLDTKRKHVRWMLAVLNDRSRYMHVA